MHSIPEERSPLILWQPGHNVASRTSGFTHVDKPDYTDYSRCVHCGLCLNHCPTYRLWHSEADSPRGRIRQIQLIDEGRLDLGEAFVRHIDRCLDCRACETACPSGVEYGKLVEAARVQIEQQYRRPVASRLARDLAYRRLLAYPLRIAAVARILRLYQRSGLARLARGTGALRLLGLESRERLLPAIDSEFFFREVGKTFPAKGPHRARVALFAGCIAQVTFSDLNRSTIRVLQANGCEVVVPSSQVCCGALPAHAGVRDVARALARTNLSAFLLDTVDAILTNAAGCGSTLKEYGRLLGVGEEHDRAAAFASKVRDVSEFLAELGLVAPMHPVALRVTYQDSCHLAHGQKIREAPRKLIGSVPGVELLEMRLADQCCGSAGVYNITQTKASMELLALKMECVRETQAAAIVTSNPGCILQLRAATAQSGLEVLHVIDLLERAIGV